MKLRKVIGYKADGHTSLVIMECGHVKPLPPGVYDENTQRFCGECMDIPIYRAKDSWVLGTCKVCRTLNYVEPHDKTAECPKCKRWTEHDNIPYSLRNSSGTRMIKQLPKE